MGKSNDDNHVLGFYDVITALKNDIKKLEEENNTPYFFQIEKAEVELSVAIEKEVSGGIKIWVVQFGGQVKKENIHKIKLELTPLVDEGGSGIGQQKQQETQDEKITSQVTDTVQKQNTRQESPTTRLPRAKYRQVVQRAH